MKQPRKVDVNQPAIVAGLRQAGAKVQDLHEVGKGCGDILVGWQGVLHVIEIKAPGKRADLTPEEVRWHGVWQGYPVHVCETLHECLHAIGAIQEPTP